MSKTHSELAVDLVGLWLQNEAATSETVSRLTTTGSSKSAKELSQAYIDFYNTILNDSLPTEFESEKESETIDSEPNEQ